jgi:hypothetical protein
MDGRKHNIVSSIIHPRATLSSFSTRRGQTKAGYGEKPGYDYIMAAEDVAKVAVLMAALGRGESLRGDDPAEQHAFVYPAGVRPRINSSATGR